MISLNAKELAQLLNDRGWYVVRQRGSHARWYNRELNVYLTVPNHGSKPIPKGTLHSILRTVGINPSTGV